MARANRVVGALMCCLLFAWGCADPAAGPQRALDDISAAVKDQNQLRFEALVDVEALQNQLLTAASIHGKPPDTVVVAPLATTLADSIDDPASANRLGQRLAASRLALLKDGSLRERTLNDLVCDTTSLNGQSVLALMTLVWAGLEPGRIAGLGNIQVEGEQAVAPVLFDHPRLDTTLVLEVRLAKGEENWKLTRFNNLDAYLTNLAGLRKAVITQYNEEIQARIDSLLEIGSPRVLDREAWQTWYEIVTSVRNRSESRIGESTYFSLRARGIWDADMFEMLREPLSPGESTNVESSVFENMGFHEDMLAAVRSISLHGEEEAGVKLSLVPTSVNVIEDTDTIRISKKRGWMSYIEATAECEGGTP